MGGIWIPWIVDAANAAVRGTGYQVVVVDGYQARGHGGFNALEGVVGHHTGTADSAPGDYPTLRIVRDGRSDLAGPLCNYGLGRSGTIYVVAAGVAWHAGASAYAGMVDLNSLFLGIEAESAGAGRWTPQQLDVYPRLVGSALNYIRRSANRYASHRTVATPAGRKDDPRGIEDVWMQQRVAAFLSGSPVTAAPAPHRLQGDELVGDIAITKFDDGSFRALEMCEAGDNSLAVARAFITFGVAWGGPVDFTLTALANGRVMTQKQFKGMANNSDGWWEVPSGCRMVTIEGKAPNPNVEISAARVVLPK